jgi:hypothetical protein
MGFSIAGIPSVGERSVFEKSPNDQMSPYDFYSGWNFAAPELPLFR